MLDRRDRLLTHLIVGTLLFWVNATQAQGDRWYRVELIIFSHTSGQNAEPWEAIPDLAYPQAANFLFESARIESARQQQLDRAEKRTTTSTPETVNADSLSEGVQNVAVSDEIGVRAAMDSVTQSPSASEPDSAPLAGRLPTPFVILPRQQLEFDGKAAYMNRSGKYQILFHKAWAQPVVGKSKALSLILDRSGDGRDWPRLQGSIKLYIARYLHLQTDFWLNTDGEYLDGTWRMPAPPLAFAAVGASQPPLEPSPPAEPGMTDFQPSPQLPETMNSAIESSAPDSLYPFRHAVTLRQHRRMRSNEVHYIDHPMLGVVVKLTPLDVEQLEAMAALEAP
jgi:hypothetical protein